MWKGKNRMKHLMIDIETLGLEVGSVVLSLGAVVFEPYRQKPVYPTVTEFADSLYFYRVFNRDSQIWQGKKISADTLCWWSGQGEAWRKLMSEPQEDVYLALTELSKFCTRIQPCAVWGHGAAFDLSHVENFYRSYQLDPPWHYRMQRDTRTLYDVVYGKDEAPRQDLPYGFVKHHALYDAWLQAQSVYDAYEELSA